MDRDLFEAMHSSADKFKKIAEENKEPTLLDQFFANKYVKAGLKTMLFMIAAVFCVLLVLYLLMGGMVFLMLDAIVKQFSSEEKRVQEELAIHLKNKYQEEFRIEKVEYNGTLDEYRAEVHSVAKPDYTIRVDISELLPEEKYRIKKVSDSHSLYGEFPDENAIIFGAQYISFQEAIDRQLVYLDVRYERMEEGTAAGDELKNVHQVVELAKSFHMNRMWIEIRSKKDRRELSCRINDANSIASMADLEKVCE